MGKKKQAVTETDWLAGDKPAPLLRFLGKRLSDRKRRLFAAACCRRLWHLLTDERSRGAVEVAERFADGAATERELNAAEESAHEAFQAVRAHAAPGAAAAADAVYATVCHGVGWDIGEYASRNATDAVRATGGKLAAAAEGAAQGALLRDLCGNPFRERPALDSRWGTRAVLALTRPAYEDRDFALLPLLADALEEAGCADKELLGHLRGPGPHVRGCWVLDLLLGRA